MKYIDEAILAIDKNIFKNIENDYGNRGYLSQNVLAQLRNLVEHIAMKCYFEDKDGDLSGDPKEKYKEIRQGLKYIKSNYDYNDIFKFHEMLQKSASHYTLSEENSERLMLKYYEYLLRIKKTVEEKFSFNILSNLDKFPIDLDTQLIDYYKKIASKLDLTVNIRMSEERYYIQKIKPFFINNEVYYEVTFSEANERVSKFNRIIGFTKKRILPNYSVKLAISYENVDMYGKNMPILIINDWKVSIRPCELNNFLDILDESGHIQANHSEYKRLMDFLTKNRLNLLDVFSMKDDMYLKFKNYIIANSKVLNLVNGFDKCRNLILNNAPGSNILRYLVYTLNNKIINLQRSREECKVLSHLKLKYGCKPFDDIPLNTSLINHNPSIYDLIQCIDITDREDELLARKLRMNAELNGILYTERKELENFSDIDSLVKKYNSKLYFKHVENRKIESVRDNYYINGYEKDTVEIIKTLRDLTNKNINNYTNSVNSWLKNIGSYNIDCDEKKQILQNMFSNSKVFSLYGAAGTGKSTMINHVCNFFSNKKKALIANTNPAVDNLKRKITAANCEYKTITKFLKEDIYEEYDLLVIDECSTVSNCDMNKILHEAKFDLLLLVGDPKQIEAITFGNWFKLIQYFLPEKSMEVLKETYRAEDKGLLSLWKVVRENEDLIEYLTATNCSRTLGQEIFKEIDDDEIILCLNYDGLYGINNINRLFQSNNPNTSVNWGVQSYKEGDPILFTESTRFSPVLFNNLRGRIINIEKYDTKITFDIEIEKVINGKDCEGMELELISSTESNCIVRFSVYKYNSDNDSIDDKTSIPFQIAYASSIHKAQGLEFNSVKIIITDEVDELITHSTLYTAVTRARKKLNIFWSPETEKKVVESITINKNDRDVRILERKVGVRAKF